MIEWPSGHESPLILPRTGGSHSVNGASTVISRSLIDKRCLAARVHGPLLELIDQTSDPVSNDSRWQRMCRVRISANIRALLRALYGVGALRSHPSRHLSFRLGLPSALPHLPRGFLRKSASS